MVRQEPGRRRYTLRMSLEERVNPSVQQVRVAISPRVTAKRLHYCCKDECAFLKSQQVWTLFITRRRWFVWLCTVQPLA